MYISELGTSEVIIPSKSEEAVVVGKDEVFCSPVRVIIETPVSGLSEERVKVGIVVLVTVLKVGTSEVSTSDTVGDKVEVEKSDLFSVSELVAIEGKLPDTVLETSGVIGRTVRLFSEE